MKEKEGVRIENEEIRKFRRELESFTQKFSGSVRFAELNLKFRHAVDRLPGKYKDIAEKYIFKAYPEWLIKGVDGNELIVDEMLTELHEDLDYLSEDSFHDLVQTFRAYNALNRNLKWF